MPTINTDGTCLCGIQAHTCTYHKPEPNPYATLTKRFGFGPVPGTLTVEAAGPVHSGTTIKLDDVELGRTFYYCRAPSYTATVTF